MLHNILLPPKLAFFKSTFSLPTVAHSFAAAAATTATATLLFLPVCLHEILMQSVHHVRASPCVLVKCLGLFWPHT